MSERQFSLPLTSDTERERSEELQERSSERKNYLLRDFPSMLMIIDPPAPYGIRKQKKS